MIGEKEEMTDKERILIVDDDESTGRTLKHIFGKKRYETEAVGTGREAIEKAKGNFFNIALLDIKLPDMEGVELVAPLKELHPDMVVIMITAYASVETAVQALNEGASAYITKPLNMEEVLKTVADVLEKQKLIEEKRRAEEALKESEEKYSTIVEKGNDGIIVIQDGLVKFVNSKMIEIAGFLLEEALGKSFVDFILPEYKELVLDRYKKRIAGEIVPNRYEIEILSKDGRKIPVEINASKIEYGGRPADLAIVRDITERKRAEEKLKEYAENLEKLVEERTKALKESEEKLKAILTGIGDLITIQNKDLDIIWVNQPIRDIWGDIIGKKCYEVLKGLTEKCPDCTVEKVLNEEKTIISERVAILPDGGHIPVLVTSSPVRDAGGNIVAVVEVVKDITERKQLEIQLKEYAENLEKKVEKRTKALKESEEKLKAILTGIGDLITIQNKDLDIIWVNQAVKDIWGEVIGKKCYEIYKGSDAPCPDCSVEKVLNEGKTVVSERFSILPDGKLIQTLVTSSPMRDAQGNIVAVVELIRDITERKKLEKQLKDYTENLEKLVEKRTSELKESEERYRGLYESSIDGIFSVDMDSNIMECNQSFVDMLGYTKEELYNLSIRDILPRKWHDLGEKIIDEQVLLRGYSEEYETKMIKKDGTGIPVSARMWFIKDKFGNPTGLWGIVRDITERHRLMEMKEQFISIATHELRTPLISIKGYVDFLRTEDLESKSELIEPSLDVVSRNTDRLLRLTDDLLDIQRIKSERLQLELESLNLTELINHCAEEIQPFINKKKQNFHLEVPEGSLMIQGDHIRLSQAIMNLLNNATKFTPEGGNITLSMEEKEDVIQIQVTDTGIGLRKEDLERVFQSFADIKKPTHIKGTGLGLSVTKGLVEAHGGEIWVHSDGEGKGATFTIILPKRKVKEVS